MSKKETVPFIGVVASMIRAAGRRAAAEDEHELRALYGLRAEVDKAIESAVQAQHERRQSWGYIGDALGMSRQAAFQRFGRRDAA